MFLRCLNREVIVMELRKDNLYEMNFIKVHGVDMANLIQ